MTDSNSYKTIWEADSTHPEISSKLREALKDVLDPEIGMNIIQMGLVRNVTISEDGALINMILTTPFCPYGPSLLEQTTKKAEKALKIPVEIDLGMEAWDMSMIEDDTGFSWGLY